MKRIQPKRRSEWWWYDQCDNPNFPPVYMRNQYFAHNPELPVCTMNKLTDGRTNRPSDNPYLEMRGPTQTSQWKTRHAWKDDIKLTCHHGFVIILYFFDEHSFFILNVFCLLLHNKSTYPIKQLSIYKFTVEKTGVNKGILKTEC